jgi:hypothetical protein
MWALDNRTPYAAERAWLRDREGAYHFIVAVRASFALGSDGAVTLAPAQPPPCCAPEYEGEPELSSLARELDLGPLKPTTEVLLRAHAHAPDERARACVAVSLRVGALHKQLLVHGERHYRDDGFALTEAQPFVRREIRYELAFGGSDPSDQTPGRRAGDKRNPVGRGFALDPRTRAGQRAPSVTYLDGELERRGPAGFGPIASHWSPRRELAGRFDAAWHETQRPLLPLDYDPRFALAAPSDQQLPDYLVGGEPVELCGMTREGTLRFVLPVVDLTFVSRFRSGQTEHAGRLVTVSIEPEDGRLSLVLQTSLRVASRQVEQLDEVVIAERTAS